MSSKYRYVVPVVDEVPEIVFDKSPPLVTVTEPVFTEVVSEFYTDEPLVDSPDSEAVTETAVVTTARVIKSVLDMKIEPIVKAPKAKKEKVVKGPTNASLIREQVHLAKDNGIDPSVVIAWAMENVGHTKGMATGYVKAIWKEVYPKV